MVTQKLKELEDFIQDLKDSELTSLIQQKKEENAKKFNIFKVLKLDNHEIRHSNFLAWLLNPKETHNCGDKFLQAFINIALGKTIINTSDIIVDTEYITNKNRRIDILIHSKSSEFVCVIENKYGSDEHDEQCRHYKEFIEKESLFTGYKKFYIFLDIYAPSKEQLDTDLCGYESVTYQDILSILINMIQTETPQQNVEQAIKQYIEILKEKYSIMDENIKTKCAEIYKQYKDVLSVLNQYERELHAEIFDIMKSLIDNPINQLRNIARKDYGYGRPSYEWGFWFVPQKYYDEQKIITDSSFAVCYPLLFSLRYRENLTLGIWRVKTNTSWKMCSEKEVHIEFAGRSKEEISENIMKAITEMLPEFEKFACC